MSAAFALDPQAFEGLLRITEFLLPVGGPFPPVRAMVKREDASVSVGAVPVGDRNALIFILKVFRWIPRWATGIPIHLLLFFGKLPGPLGGPLRLLMMGLDGLAYTLYFSAPGTLSVLRWDADLRSLGLVGEKK